MKELFDNLFVLELANNHWGSLQRGKQIVKDFALVSRENNIKTAIKLQFRDVESMVHTSYKKIDKNSIVENLCYQDRYLQKTLKTKMSFEDMSTLVSQIKKLNCIPMVTPFDENSVDWCNNLEIPILKIASSDINDWILLNKVASTKKPVIISTGGANQKQIDDVVSFFNNRNIPLAINHCVSKYPTEDHELELNQIDYLKYRYPKHTIGFSSHEYHDWESSMFISYAKGARTWERHIDIEYSDNDEQKSINKYCSTPEQIDIWFKAFKKAEIMCGNSSQKRRIIDNHENKYLLSLHRGLYFKENMSEGQIIKLEDLYPALPLIEENNHISSRTFVNDNYILKKNVTKNMPLLREDIK